MTVGQTCTRSVVTAQPEETIQAVAQRMAQDDVGTLVVVEGNRPVGIITDRDLVLRVMAKELRPQDVTVRAAMTGHPVCVSEHMALEEAMALMRGYPPCLCLEGPQDVPSFFDLHRHPQWAAPVARLYRWLCRCRKLPWAGAGVYSQYDR